jgi:hypothetical protein
LRKWRRRPNWIRRFKRGAPNLIERFGASAIFCRNIALPITKKQDTLNRQIHDWFVAALTGRVNFNDGVMSALLVNYAMALRYDRPTLYCERELGEALQRTDLPSDLTVADLNFKWPQLRIILPLNLLTINREGQLYSVTYLDMSMVQGGRM